MIAPGGVSHFAGWSGDDDSYSARDMQSIADAINKYISYAAKRFPAALEMLKVFSFMLDV